MRDLLHDEALASQERVLRRYLKPDLLTIDDMGMKQLPKRPGEYLSEIILMRREVKSTLNPQPFFLVEPHIWRSPGRGSGSAAQKRALQSARLVPFFTPARTGLAGLAPVKRY